MKVKQLKINSFRGIKHLTLDFDFNEPTVFIGINGVGKSSILDCLAILLSWFIARIQNSRGAGIYFTDLDINSQNKIGTYNEITVYNSDLQDISWTVTRVKRNIKKRIYNTHLGALKSLVESIHSKIEVDSKTSLPLAVYYPTNRAVLDVPLRIKQKHLFEPMNAYDSALTKGKIDFRRFFEWFRNREDLENQDYRHNLKAEPDRQLEAVRQAIYQILVGFSNLRVERSPLRMTLEKEGEKLIVNQLSDGEKCLLAMVGDLARRLAIANPSYQDALQGEAVVLIDEIELHLHPEWQRKIISVLKRTFPNCQFIITTHSPQVLSNVQPENIYVLESTDEGIVAKKPSSSFGRDSNSILEDIMGVPERPQEIKEDILRIFRLIESGNLTEAQQLRQAIADKIGSDEPELIKAATSIRRREILDR